MTNYNNSKPSNPLKIISNEIADLSDEIHNKLSKSAAEHGYTRDLFRNIAHDPGLPPGDPLYPSAVNSLASFRDMMRSQVQVSNSLYPKVDGTAYNLASSVGLSGCLSNSMPNIGGYQGTPRYVYSEPARAPFWPPDREETYALKLEKLDREIGRVYREVVGTFYGTINNPERSALFLMRQVCDHFFYNLAPDDEVRSSGFFRKKDPPKEDQIYRSERIKYAANKYTKDELMEAHLVSASNYFNENYKRLNEAHSRQPLDRESVRAALTATRSFLEEWVDVIGL